MSQLDRFDFQAAWSNSPQSAADSARRLQATLDGLGSRVARPVVWHASGSRKPLATDLSSLELTVRRGVFVDAGTGEQVAELGSQLGFAAWDADDHDLVGPVVISIGMRVGKSQAARARTWPNQIQVEVNQAPAPVSGIPFAVQVLRLVVDAWPVEWARIHSDESRAALEPNYQPNIDAGLVTWIAARHAQVPAVVPGAGVSHVKDGSLIVVAGAASGRVDPKVLRTVNRRLRRKGSLPPIPTSRH